MKLELFHTSSPRLLMFSRSRSEPLGSPFVVRRLNRLFSRAKMSMFDCGKRPSCRRETHDISAKHTDAFGKPRPNSEQAEIPGEIARGHRGSRLRTSLAHQLLTIKRGCCLTFGSPSASSCSHSRFSGESLNKPLHSFHNRFSASARRTSAAV
jgi:hypothetical protein